MKMKLSYQSSGLAPLNFFLGSLLIPMAVMYSCDSTKEKAVKPNVVIIFVDDMGYGDPGCYGSKLNRTPNIDRMAEEGMLFTDFHVGASVCSPSRAALLTGCYPMRVDMAINDWAEGMKQVLFPVSTKGLNPSEVTIADMLKEQGYRTACIGKWHQGDQPAFLPDKQGFDYYYGIPYSNDMGEEQFPVNPPLPLVKNETVIEAPVEQNTITRRYTEEALKFMKADPGKPFFVYLPHTMVHYPLHASERFRGKSENGIYGDAVEEVDWSVGQILDYLKEAGIDNKTLVFFTSDNGGVPRLGASNLPLAGSKGTIWEGGCREPFIAWWPGRIPAGRVNNALTTSMDFLPTIAGFCGGKVPDDRIIDGKNISSLLLGEDTVSPTKNFYYYQKNQLQAVRSGDWKLMLPLDNKILYAWRDTMAPCEAQLFNLREDIGETTDLSEEHPEIVEQLMVLADSVREDLGDYGKEGRNVRKAGYLKEAHPMVTEPQGGRASSY